MWEEFHSKGIRISLEAEPLLSRLSPSQREKLLQSGKPLIGREDVESLLLEAAPLPSSAVDVIREPAFKPVAKEYDADIRVHTPEEGALPRIGGQTQDFIAHFRDRYRRLAQVLAGFRSRHATLDLADLPRHVNERARIIVMVYEKRVTQKGNLLLEVEDLTGRGRVVISKNSRDEKVFARGQEVVLDDIVAISGKILEPYMIAEDIEWPEMPVARERRRSEEDLAAVYISDTHFGSRYYLHRYMDRFLEWIHGRGDAPELAGKVKYVVLAGDVVDGVGVYPNHVRELAVADVYKQYAMFDDFVEKLPDHIEVIVVPGNHDAVRRAEPMPAIDKDFIRSDCLRLPNPASVSIEKVKHLLYHGTSLDSLIANIKQATYTQPEKVMVEYLRRRHLSPIYGTNLIVPYPTDRLVIEEEPDVLHCGHVHKNGYGLYRNTLIVNSGTFQDRTEFQIKQGHVPTPGVVPVYELKHGRLRTLDFRDV